MFCQNPNFGKKTKYFDQKQKFTAQANIFIMEILSLEVSMW